MKISNAVLASELLALEHLTGNKVELSCSGMIHDSCTIVIWVRYTNNDGKECINEYSYNLLEEDSLLDFLTLSLHDAYLQIVKELHNDKERT